MTVEQIMEDNALALKIATDSSASCKNFTHKDMLNPSPDYMYANNPGIYVCSSELMKAALPQPVAVATCNFVIRQASCPFYSPDFSVLLKSSVTTYNNTITFTLSRFRSFNGSYFYKIYDSNGVVYFDLSYPEISNVNKEIDEEAKGVFFNFLNECSSQPVQDLSVENVSDLLSDQQEQKNTKSYLSSLIS